MKSFGPTEKREVFLRQKDSAALEAQAAALRQKQALAPQEAQLMAEKEELQIQTALAVSNAKIKVYEDHEIAECDGMNEDYDAAATTHKQER